MHAMMACPEDLDPKNVCTQNKVVHPAKEGNRWETPEANPVRAELHLANRFAYLSARLIRKLGLSEFRNVGPLSNTLLAADRVGAKLKQHVGAPCQSLVALGHRCCFFFFFFFFVANRLAFLYAMPQGDNVLFQFSAPTRSAAQQRVAQRSKVAELAQAHLVISRTRPRLRLARCNSGRLGVKRRLLPAANSQPPAHIILRAELLGSRSSGQGSRLHRLHSQCSADNSPRQPG